MISILKNILSDSRNLNKLNLSFQKLKKEIEIEKIFSSIEKYSNTSEIRYVGGCVRKIINNEEVDDIDLAVNLNPNQMIEVFKKSNIKTYDTGIDHGTITVLINKKKFEIIFIKIRMEINQTKKNSRTKSIRKTRLKHIKIHE